MDFDKNVFINCPFDENYLSLLRPLLFTVLYLGYMPRIALERLDSGETRISKIIELIRESKYSIHDLSRIVAGQEGELFRLNMPFELGMDMGCRSFKGGKWKKKKCLILEEQKYRIKAALSDLSNSDIEAHENEPKKVVTVVRNWLRNVAAIAAPGPEKIWGDYIDFRAYNYDISIDRGLSQENIETMDICELMDNIRDWIRNNR